MSDYLDNLLKRNQTTPADIRPRQRARFEPDTSGEMIQAVDRDLFANGNFEPRPRARLVPPVADQAQASPRNPTRTIVDIQPTNHISPRQDMASASHRASVAHPEAITPRTVSVIDQPDGIASRTIRPFSPLSPAKTSHNPPADETRLQPALSPDPQILSQLKKMTPAAPPSPTINVTIGRVDIRAITPPKPNIPSPAQPPTPRLTLNDYLTRRKDGHK